MKLTHLIQINLREMRRTYIALGRGCPSDAMDESGIALMERLRQSPPPNMVRIPSGTFRTGSDKHYPEESPAHRVTIDSFWIDRTPVTNRQFKQFVRATGHKTFAEIAPNLKSYPGALRHMLYAGWLVFSPPHHRVDLKTLANGEGI